MSFVQRLVSPKLPTVLVNDTHVALPGHDVWLLYVNMVHVVPTKLDVSKFEDAVSRVLQLYPHTAGQLRCVDGRWSIELTNSAVPLDIEHRPDVNADSFLHEDWVLQEDPSLFLNQHPAGANLANSNAPLLRLKLTLFNDETSVGVTWNHSLGDGVMILNFIHTLSQFYQGLPSTCSPPTFVKHHFPAPSQTMAAEFSFCMPLYPTCHFNGIIDQVADAEALRGFEQVKWRIDVHSLEELCSTLCANKQNKKFLSKQDCLTAYIAAVLNHNRRNPVQMIRNVSSYRHVNASFVPENVAGNLLLLILASVPGDMAGIATAIRDAFKRFREPHYIFIVETLKGKFMLDAANVGKAPPYPFNENDLFVNSHVAFDWCSAHFGCPSSTRFYTDGVGIHFLKCFKSNPAKGDDGVWRARQSTEISIGVPAELKPKMLDTLSRGIKYMLDRQRV